MVEEVKNMNIKTENYPLVRYLDSTIYNTVRNGTELELCFTDLSEKEQNAILDGASREELIKLCKTLATDFRNVAEVEDLSNHPEATEGMKRFGFVIKIPCKRKQVKK